uniref:Uncharacterized protein n=1 Tax=Rhizophora mucronata TaxID=61149 RepID=A0A2P2QIC9_RHIMU
MGSDGSISMLMLQIDDSLLMCYVYLFIFLVHQYAVLACSMYCIGLTCNAGVMLI